MLELTPHNAAEFVGQLLSAGEIHFKYVRSSGPGGQNVNKVATAVQLRFDAKGSRRLSEATKDRLRVLAGGRFTNAGEVVLEASTTRSQSQNKMDALRRFIELLSRAAVTPKKRRATKPTEESKRKRIESKRRKGERKSMRRKVQW